MYLFISEKLLYEAFAEIRKGKLNDEAAMNVFRRQMSRTAKNNLGIKMMLVNMVLDKTFFIKSPKKNRRIIKLSGQTFSK